MNQPAPVYTQAAVISGAALPASLNSSVSTHSANTADQQLIQLWKNSNKAERQKFMAWLAEQAN